MITISVGDISVVSVVGCIFKGNFVLCYYAVNIWLPLADTYTERCVGLLQNFSERALNEGVLIL